MQSNIVLAKVNTKGQLVIPNVYRKKMGILPESQVQIKLEKSFISISPVSIMPSSLNDSSFTSVLRDTQGSWGKKAVLKTNKNLEKKISKDIKNEKW